MFTLWCCFIHSDCFIQSHPSPQNKSPWLFLSFLLQSSLPWRCHFLCIPFWLYPVVQGKRPQCSHAWLSKIHIPKYPRSPELPYSLLVVLVVIGTNSSHKESQFSWLDHHLPNSETRPFSTYVAPMSWLFQIILTSQIFPMLFLFVHLIEMLPNRYRKLVPGARI